MHGEFYAKRCDEWKDLAKDEPLRNRVGHAEEVSAVRVAPPALHRLRVGEAQNVVLAAEHLVVGDVNRKNFSREMHSRFGPVQCQPRFVFAGHLRTRHI